MLPLLPLCHKEFRLQLDSDLASLDRSQIERLRSPQFSKALHKVRALNFDPIIGLLEPRYSSKGRPGSDPALLLRSLVLMLHFGCRSIQKWHDLLESDSLFRVLCGIQEGHVPAVGTFYNLIDRLWLLPPSASVLFKEKNCKPKKAPKPKKKRGRPKKNQSLNDSSSSDQDLSELHGSPAPTSKGEKLNLNTASATVILADEAMKSVIDEDRPNRIHQLLVRFLAVDPSVKRGLISGSRLTVSGDGTALHVHSNSMGHHIKRLKETSEYEQLRHYSDPDAGYGFDSDMGQYCFGYTLYLNAVHNPDLDVDLPTLFSLYPARDHDSTLAIKSLNNHLEIFPDLRPSFFCLDSASDNEATFRLCLHYGITPVIDLNGRRGKDRKTGNITVDSKGVPSCQNGTPMALQGFDKTRGAFKYRCPFKMKKVSSCPHVETCCRNEYGRTFYLKAENIRDQTGLKHGSEKWKAIYKNRTSCERINNRVLNDYGLHQTRMLTERRLSLMAALAFINIHADAWFKTDSF